MSSIGKSSFGNTILGKETFKARISPKSVTTKCAEGERIYKGKKLKVVDTPGFFDTNCSKDENENEIAKSYQNLAPGPHAFLIVLDIKRFTEQEWQAAQMVTKIFKPGAVDYGLIIFTGSDKLIADGTTIEEYLAYLDSNDPLNLLLDQYGRRFMTVNNKGTDMEKECALEALLLQIENILAKKDGRYYSTPELEAVAVEIATLKATDEFHPVGNDGLIILYPGPKKIVAGFLRRNVGKSSVKRETADFNLRPSGS